MHVVGHAWRRRRHSLTDCTRTRAHLVVEDVDRLPFPWVTLHTQRGGSLGVQFCREIAYPVEDEPCHCCPVSAPDGTGAAAGRVHVRLLRYTELIDVYITSKHGMRM